VRGDRLLAPVAIRGAALGGVVLLAAVPVYVFVEAPWRTLVARLAVALVLGVALLQLRSAVAARLAAYRDEGWIQSIQSVQGLLPSAGFASLSMVSSEPTLGVVNVKPFVAINCTT